MNVLYWRQGMGRQNFGDALNDYLLQKLGDRPNPPLSHENDILFLVGSVIDDAWLKMAEERRGDAKADIVYWSCGWRGRNVAPDFLSKCKVLAVRGPLTRKKLSLPDDIPIGDSALTLPLLYTPKGRRGGQGVVCVPHFGDKRSDAEIRAETGADSILRPAIKDAFAAVETFIDRLWSADFLLCGAMHGAITAVAYGIPFSFYDGGGIDGPPKWSDFAKSVGLEAAFHRNRETGAAWYEGNAPQISPPSLSALLSVCPVGGAAGVLEKAGQYDGLGPVGYASLLDAGRQA